MFFDMAAVCLHLQAGHMPSVRVNRKINPIENVAQRLVVQSPAHLYWGYQHLRRG